MRFEWDEEKSRANLKKHGVRFEDAETVWADAQSLEYFDVLHSVEEERYVKIGFSARSTLLTVVHTEREDLIRVVSARHATLKERKRYEEGI